MRRSRLINLAAVCAALLIAPAARAAEIWESLPRPPAMPAPVLEGRVTHLGARIWFATFGEGTPVILLHGAMGDADSFAGQVPALVARGHRVIVIDSRGQGRSTIGAGPLGYELMESDVIAVMDSLGVRRAAVVGWSDGGILGLIMAMKHPARVGRVFAFGANMDLTGVAPGALDKPIVGQLMPMVQADYQRLSPTPDGFGAMAGAVETMLTTQPNYTARDLAKIHGPAIAIVDGDHEELITPAHTRYLARTIPGARLIILKNVSHFAPWQAPAAFNAAMIGFLDGR